MEVELDLAPGHWDGGCSGPKKHVNSYFFIFYKKRFFFYLFKRNEEKGREREEREEKEERERDLSFSALLSKIQFLELD